MEFVEGLCNEVCNLNQDVKDERTKVIRLGKNKQTEIQVIMSKNRDLST